MWRRACVNNSRSRMVCLELIIGANLDRLMVAVHRKSMGASAPPGWSDDHQHPSCARWVGHPLTLDIGSSKVKQFELDLESADHGSNTARAPQAKPQLMAALDSLNERFGRGTLKLASAGAGVDPRNWTMKRELRTPAYTMRWEDMPVVRA